MFEIRIPHVAGRLIRPLDSEQGRTPMRMAGLAVVILVGTVALIHGQTRTVDFEQDALGQAPEGFELGHTANVGAPGKWLVQAEGNNKYLAQLDADSTRLRFPVAVLTDITAANVDLSVLFKPVSGRVDQGAGLVWRFRNEDNYYVVRANALEDNVVLYKVENGRRTDLPLKGVGRTYGKEVEVPSGRWSQLSVNVAGNLFQVFLNRDKLFEVEDGTFSNAGKIGLWTKADSVTYFDDFSITVRR